MGTRATLVMAAAALLALAPVGAAQASITVENQNNSGTGSLRQALIAAPPGETIIVPAGTYTLTGDPLEIVKSVTIAGHGSADTTIRAGEAIGVFEITGPLEATISGVTIRDGQAGGAFSAGAGIQSVKANLTIRDAVLTHNTLNADGAPGNAGGIAEGAGIFITNGSLNLIGSQITGNSASARGGSEKRGGLVYGVGLFSISSSVTISNSTISDNTADLHGGEGIADKEQYGGSGQGIGVWAGEGTLSVTGSTMAGNSAGAQGGSGARGGFAEGIGVFSSLAPLTISQSTISANSADVRGGAGPPTTEQNGGIVEGGGVWVAEAPLTLSDSRVLGNTLAAAAGSGAHGGIGEGGGVWSAGRMTIASSTIIGNSLDSPGGQGPSTADQFGGIAQGGGLWAIPEKAGGASSVTATTVAGNSIDASGGIGARAGVAQGGGVFGIAATDTISFSRTTIAANVARADSFAKGGIADGGGFWGVLEKAPPMTLTAMTLDGNRVEASGPVGEAAGGNLWSEKGVEIRNSIVADGAGPAGSENCNAEAGTSLDFNIDSLDQCNFHAAGDKISTAPLLGPLQDNGGPTPTMAPAADSPAVDQGAAFGLAADQRGVARPIDLPSIPNTSAPGGDASDIGAVELRPSNAFALGKLKKNKKKGTARLSVLLPLPSAGSLTLEGKGLKAQHATVTGQGEVKLKVIGKGRVKKALRKKGKRKVQIKVTYAPTGNLAATLSRKAKLVRKKHHKHRKGHGKKR